MKTRVRKWFDHTLGVTLYAVEVLDHWRDGELRCYYPKAVRWQQVRSTNDELEALRCAEALAYDRKDVSNIVAEFGMSSLVETDE